MGLHRALLFAFALGVMAPQARAEESCTAEAAKTLRPALLRAILDEYPGRADAPLQLELAAANAIKYVKLDDCPRALAALKRAPEDDLAAFARLIVGLQSVQQSVARIEREVNRGAAKKP